MTAIAILSRFATYLFMQEQAIVEVLRLATLFALLILSLHTKPKSIAAVSQRNGMIAAH